jgi:hypothetical protein
MPNFPGRPEGATGEVLRVLTVNDVYKLDNLGRLKTAIARAKAEAPPGVKVVASISGDFLSPCLYSSLDGGRTMAEALGMVGFDYACLGNHEFGAPRVAVARRPRLGARLAAHRERSSAARAPPRPRARCRSRQTWAFRSSSRRCAASRAR